MHGKALLQVGPARTPPAALGWPGLGALPWMWRDIPGYFTAIAKRHGEVVGFKLARQQVYLISSAEAVQHVYRAEVAGRYDKRFHYEEFKGIFGDGVFNIPGGEPWRRRRRLLQPFFTKDYVNRWHQTIVGATTATLDEWEPRATAGEAFDIAIEAKRLIQSILAEILFGSDLPRTSSKQAISAIQTLSHEVLRRILRSFLFGGALNRLPRPSWHRYDVALRHLDETVALVAGQTPDSGTAAESLASMLRHAEDKESGSRMDRTELRDEIATLFFAGQDTTANALTWTFHHLSQHPEIARRAHEEIVDVAGDAPPTVAQLEDLHYTRAAIAESLRLSPPAYAVSRTSISEDVVNGYRVSPNSLMALSQYVTHHNPRYWASPLSFDPTRFLNAEEQRPRYAYFPYGGGQRICLGMHLANLELVSIVAMVMQRYSVRPVPGHRISEATGVTLTPRYGIRVYVGSRPEQ